MNLMIASPFKLVFYSVHIGLSSGDFLALRKLAYGRKVIDVYSIIEHLFIDLIPDPPLRLQDEVSVLILEPLMMVSM